MATTWVLLGIQQPKVLLHSILSDRNKMKIQLEDKEIEIKKLPIGRYAEFLKIIKEIFAKSNFINDLTLLSDKEFLSKLPEIIIENLPQVLQIISVGTFLSKEEVEKLGLNECLDILLAIFEVNKYEKVYEKIKKGLARLPEKSIQKNQIG